MDKFEAAILLRLQKYSNNFAGYVDLMIAAQITGSEDLHKQALKALIASHEKPNLAQSKRLGLEAVHAIMMAKLVTAEASRGKCENCSAHTNWYCESCESYQGS
jgi:hypothetical protein